MKFCKDCGAWDANTYLQYNDDSDINVRTINLCPNCAKVHIDKGEDLRLFGSDVSAQNSNQETDTNNNNSTTTADKSLVETTDTNSSYLFGVLAKIIACVGFFLGIILGQVFPAVDLSGYRPKEVFNFGLMIGTWAGTAVLSISLWAVRCILNYQEIIIEKLNKN